MDRERNMTIGEVWRTAGRTFRAICLTLPAIGILLVLLGAYGDVRGFWITRPFLTNVASGLTAACFGIPFTLLVLGWLTNSQARRAQEKAVRNFAGSSAKAFRDAVFMIISSRWRHNGLREIESLLRLLSESQNAITEVIRRYYEDGDKHHRVLNDVQSELVTITKDLLRAIDLWESLLSSIKDSNSWTNITFNWNFIVNEIYPAMLRTTGISVSPWLMVRVSELINKPDWEDGWLPNIWQTDPGKTLEQMATSRLTYENSVSKWMCYNGVVAEIYKAERTVYDIQQLLVLAEQVSDDLCADKNTGLSVTSRVWAQTSGSR